jgi:hypothetical protein
VDGVHILGLLRLFGIRGHDANQRQGRKLLGELSRGRDKGESLSGNSFIALRAPVNPLAPRTP